MTRKSEADNGPEVVRVLLVEDSEGDAALIEAMLCDVPLSPHRITHVTSLAEAASAAARSAHDLVLLDLSLPGTVGLESLRTAQSLFPETPIIVLTGLDDDQVAIAAVRQGAQDYWVKGEIERAPLRRAIQYAIERRRFDRLQNSIYRADRLASLGHLAASVAHEVNNPAAFLLANLNVLQENINSLQRCFEDIATSTSDSGLVEGLLLKHRARTICGQSQEILEDNLEGLERIRRIAQDLRVFARDEGDEVEWIRLNDLVIATCNMVQNEVRHKATLIKDLEPLPPIAGRRGKLSQVLLNLLINAIHALPEGEQGAHEVRVSTCFKEGMLRLRVADTGCGISTENLNRIFDPLYTTKASAVGTGLGLPLAVETVRAHGGTIEVQSRPGEGSVFEVVIPEETGLMAKGPRNLNSPTEKYDPDTIVRILLIDDEEMVRRAFKRMLVPHEVTEAACGREALEILEGGAQFDVILCDLMMPGIDGPRLYTSLKDSIPEMCPKMIFISGGVFSKRAREFVKTTEATVLEKPIGAEDLLKAIDGMSKPNSAHSASASEAQ